MLKSFYGTIYKEFNMKVLLLKALFCAVFTTTLFFNTNLAIAAPAVTEGVEVMQPMVDLNKSTLEELVTLKGIGHKKAQAILAYREQMGDFNSIDELINVKGVGDKILEDNLERLKL